MSQFLPYDAPIFVRPEVEKPSRGAQNTNSADVTATFRGEPGNHRNSTAQNSLAADDRDILYYNPFEGESLSHSNSLHWQRFNPNQSRDGGIAWNRI